MLRPRPLIVVLKIAVEYLGGARPVALMLDSDRAY